LQESSTLAESWSEFVPRVARLPITIYKQRRNISYLWKLLKAKGSFGSTDVALLGAAGSGKSVLWERLAKLPGELSYNKPLQSRSTESHVVWIESKPQLLRAPPGQASRERSATLDEIFSRAESLKRLLYVVDYGFNVPRTADAANILLQRAPSVPQFRTEMQRIEVNEFVKVAARIPDFLAKRNAPLRLTIAVNKCDLFPDQLNDAQVYYSLLGTSSFSRTLSDLVREVGSTNLIVDHAPVCCIGEDFHWNGNIVRSALSEAEIRSLFRAFVNVLNGQRV
jgi:hypothetical protein